jgi:hypothetical protein
MGDTKFRVVTLRLSLAIWSVIAALWLADSVLAQYISTGLIHDAWAAAIPWIVSGVSALASLYSSNKAAKSQNKAINQQGDLIGLQRDAANRLMPWGEALMRQGGGALSSLLPWYTKAATGDRTALEQLIRPELQQIRQNYDVPLQQLTELSPRTGTTAAGNASILSGRAGAMNSAILGTRAAGMQGLQGLAGQLAGLGSGAVGASFGGLQGAASGNANLITSLYNLRNQNNQDSEAAGAALADFLKAYQTWNAGRSTAPQAAVYGQPARSTYSGTPSNPYGVM